MWGGVAGVPRPQRDSNSRKHARGGVQGTVEGQGGGAGVMSTLQEHQVIQKQLEIHMLTTCPADTIPVLTCPVRNYTCPA